MATFGEKETDQASYDWTAVYKTLLDEDTDELPQSQPKPPVSAACSHDHSAERAIYDLSIDDKIARISGHHSKGNSFFEEGQYDRALIQYKQAMVVYEYSFPDDDKTWELIDKLRFNCNLNAAASANELGLLSESIQNCYEALKVEPHNVKALYRRAQAHRRLDNFEEAKSDISKALEQRPHDIQLREELVLLKSQIKAYNENSRTMAGKMIRPEENKNTNPVVSKLKSKRGLLSNYANEDYVGADDMDDPVMFDTQALSELIQSIGNDDMGPILRPHETTSVKTTTTIDTSGPISNPSAKESWVFGDLNRPGAFVRQRPRTGDSTGKNCLCCT